MPRRGAVSALVTLLIAPVAARGFDGAMPVPVPGPDHIFAPGPTSLGLPGLNVNPSSIGDFDGQVALAYVKGRATGADGHHFTMVNDMRIMTGAYLAADGSPHMGSFAFI
jgi:hypothetical protein